MNKFLFNLRYKEPYGKRFLSCDRSKYKRFNSEDTATEWAEKHYREWTENYGRIYGYSGFYSQLNGYMTYYGSKDPIRMYCGFIGEKVNSYMRGVAKPYVDPSQFNDALVTLLLLSPRIPENIVVYRYIPDVVIQAILQKNKEDCPYTDKGFMSCSLLYDPPNHDYFDYENVLEIHVDEQTVGVYTNLIQGCRRSEFELLILRNAQMYLIDYPYRRNNRMIYPVRLSNITDHIGSYD
ncbi:toxin [Enterococcus faecalis]|uniref:ADP-ribosyltransferase n=1 Tax=Enterococcus faecalis TaxID=1351 RepID=UPI001F070B31|nr:ADP-ribosyltransferase [Enterococcus faecalis]MCH1672941.1 toxin [Enterococcus faecalis]